MNKIFASAFIVASSVSCVTSRNTLKEPERSEFYFHCLANQIHVTTCECLEDRAVKESGLRSLENVDQNSEEAKKFIESVYNSFDECSEATRKLMENE